MVLPSQNTTIQRQGNECLAQRTSRKMTGHKGWMTGKRKMEEREKKREEKRGEQEKKRRTKRRQDSFVTAKIKLQ